MRKLFTLIAGALTMTAAVALTAGAGRADDWKPEEGYVSLFNGKDLTGWRYANSKDGAEAKTLDGLAETKDKRFAVADGVIALAEGKGVRDLYALPEHAGGFHLKLEYRAAAKASGGITLRGQRLAVRDHAGANAPKGFKSGDWNELDVVVTNNVVVARVNGKTLAETDELVIAGKGARVEAKLNGKDVDAKAIDVKRGPVAAVRLNGEPLEKALPVGAKGGVGLQADSGKIEFRRIRIKPTE